MYRRSIRYLTLATGAVVYVLFAVSLFLPQKPEIRRADVLAENQTEATEPLTARQAKYLVRSVSGKVAVEDENGNIIKKTETSVSILPKSDRNRLKKGIEAADKNELRVILEDICS